MKENNNYNSYCYDTKLLYYQCIRINKIIKYLDDNKVNGNIINIIKNIENIINYG